MLDTEEQRAYDSLVIDVVDRNVDAFTPDILMRSPRLVAAVLRQAVAHSRGHSLGGVLCQNGRLSSAVVSALRAIQQERQERAVDQRVRRLSQEAGLRAEAKPRDKANWLFRL